MNRKARIHISYKAVTSTVLSFRVKFIGQAPQAESYDVWMDTEGLKVANTSTRP